MVHQWDNKTILEVVYVNRRDGIKFIINWFTQFVLIWHFLKVLLTNRIFICNGYNTWLVFERENFMFPMNSLHQTFGSSLSEKTKQKPNSLWLVRDFFKWSLHVFGSQQSNLGVFNVQRNLSSSKLDSDWSIHGNNYVKY